MKREIFDRLRKARAEKRTIVLVTELKSGRQALIEGEVTSGDLALDAEGLAAAKAAAREDVSGPLGEGELFAQVFSPPLRLFVVGAVHIAQSLVPMASLAGYDVTVIDPRRAFASDSRFPQVTLVQSWPDEALTALQPDHRSAIVTLTHDPKLDDPALDQALKSAAFYIGSLGSKRTHAKRLQRLEGRGFGPKDLERIHGPVGLAIGAKSPAEIAIAILAQITQARHGAPALVRQEAAA